MQNGSDILGLNVNLEGEVKERFLKIKKAKGLKNNSEAIRVIINEFYERNLKEPSI